MRRFRCPATRQCFDRVAELVAGFESSFGLLAVDVMTEKRWR